jgi:hypothetical protein
VVVQSNAQAAPAEKDWTFLIFLNGNNSLDDFGPININQAETVGSTDQVNIVVQWASLKNGDVRRLLVKKDNDPNTVTSPIVQTLPSVDMGDYHSVVDFVKWGVANYPAKHYFLDIWDHGSGWHSKKFRGLKPMDISLDENTGHMITTAQLGEALKESAAVIGHKIDIYGSDACLMAMAEVAQEMSDSVNVYVGSQEVEPGAGWPYGDFMQMWAANPSATPQQIGQMLVKAYVASYKGGSNGTDNVTFSAFDMAYLPQIDAAVKSMGAAVQKLSSTEKAKVATAFSNTQSYTMPDYVDFGDLLGVLQQASISTMDAGMYTSAKAAEKQFVIASDQNGYDKATGLSIWGPSDKSTYSQYADLYSVLQFQLATQWGDALKYLFQ